MTEDPRIAALPDIHGHAKGEHKPFAEERPIPYTARMLFLWFYHACRRGSPRFLMVADHMNYLTFEDPAAVNLVRRALKLAQAGDLYGAAETAGVELAHAATVSEGLRKGIRYSIGAEVDNDPRCRPDAQNIVDAMRPDGMIRSVHFLPITHPLHGENWMWPFDNPEFADLYEVVGTEQVWDIYMATLLEAIEKLPGHIVAHFYVPAKFGHWPADEALESYEDRLIAACAERGMAIEVNSRYLYKFYAGDEAQLERYRAAHLRLLRKAKENGVAIAVGSDAHSPKDQGRAFDAVLALLDEADINEIAFPINGRLARVALRATEEILRQASVAAAAPVRAAVASANGSAGASDGDDDDDHDDDDEAPVLSGRAPERAEAVATVAAAEPAVKAARKRPPRKKPAAAGGASATGVAGDGAAEAYAPSAEPVAHASAATPVTAPEPAAVREEPTMLDEPAASDVTTKTAEAELPSGEIARHDVAAHDVALEIVPAEPAIAEAATAEPAVAEPVVAGAAAVEEAAVEEAAVEQIAAEEAVVEAASIDELAAAVVPATEPPSSDAEPLVAEPVVADAVAPRKRAKPAPKPPAKAAPKPAAKAPAKSAASKAAAKKAPSAKAATKKAAPAKAAAAKKSAPRPAAKPVKKASAKKAAPRTAAAKGPKPLAAKRVAPAKKTVAKKTAKKKPARPRR